MPTTIIFAVWPTFIAGRARAMKRRSRCSPVPWRSIPALHRPMEWRLGATHNVRCAGGSSTRREIAEAERLARRAAELGRDDAAALTGAGIALGYVVGDLDIGIALIERALQLNPNLAWAWLFAGWLKVWMGEPEIALQHLARAMRLSPHDPQFFNMQAACASAHFFAGRYSEASQWAEIAMRDNPHHLMPASTAAASHALAGRLSEAQRALARLREIDPTLRFPISARSFPSAGRRIWPDLRKVWARQACRSELNTGLLFSTATVPV